MPTRIGGASCGRRSSSQIEEMRNARIGVAMTDPNIPAPGRIPGALAALLSPAGSKRGPAGAPPQTAGLRAMDGPTRRPSDATLPAILGLQASNVTAPAPIPIFVSRRSRAPIDPGIARALQHMEANFDLPLTLAELASVAAMPIHDFAFLFARTCGESPSARLEAVRLSEACALLRESEMDLVSTALACGYDSHDDFWLQFEAGTGVAPNVWRRAVRA